MRRCAALLIPFLATLCLDAGQTNNLRVGFAEEDITPDVRAKTVYMAGFGKNRRATAIHDPLKARAMVLDDGSKKIAIVCADVIGLFHGSVERVREKLPGFTYVLVSSTHNHEGPDTLGLWGASFFQSGIDSEYLKSAEDRIVRAVLSAQKNLTSTQATIGTAKGPELLHDARLPIVKHDDLVTLRFRDMKGDKTLGIVVQWNCHPETLESQNTQISSDFVGATVAHMQTHYHCPVVYLTGTVGGLMTSMHLEVKDGSGKALAEGTFAKTMRYGQLVGELADGALQKDVAIKLAPFDIRSQELFVPLDNNFYRLGWQLGVLDRKAWLWTGDPTKAAPIPEKGIGAAKLCLKTELADLRLGDLEVAAIPGEIYPELVLGKVTDPAEPEADFPNAPIEPAIYAQLKRKHRMIIGLANDELGYILPKRQWDERPPFAYGQKSAPYGEVNSLGPETGPILCEAFKKLAEQK